MKRIGFVGVPGTGKSSIARGIAAQSYKHIGKVELVSEYARRYLSKYGPIQNVSDQYKIMQKQLEWEDIIDQNEIDISITDSPVHMGFLYALEIRNTNLIRDAMYVNDIFKTMTKINCPPRYDIIFHLPPIWKPSSDGVRPEEHFNNNWREKTDFKIQFIFKLFPPKNFIILKTSTFEERIEECFKYCEKFL